MKKASATLVAAALAATVVSTAEAQICAGFPTGDRQFTFGARIDFPEAADQWGVEASYNFMGPLALYGGLNVVSLDAGGEDQEVFRLGAALEIPSAGASLGAGASVCPVVELNYQELSNGNRFAIPVGLGLGTSLTMGPGVGVMPYVIPQLFITRFDFDDDLPLAPDDRTDTDFGIRGGLLLGFGTFFVGGELNHLFVDNGPDPSFGVRAGIRL
jgi:hypothetical protein